MAAWDIGLGRRPPAVGGCRLVVAVPQPPEQVPEAIALEHLPLVGIIAIDSAGDPVFEAGQLLIALR